MPPRVRPPAVIEGNLVFMLDDLAGSWSRVTLDCDDAIEGWRRFRRTSYGWTLLLPQPPVRRLEYRLLLTDRQGDSTLVCDPANPERVQTAFGDRSVALMPGYESPCWTRSEMLPGTFRSFEVDDPTIGSIPVRLWSPEELRSRDRAPLLLVHDGPEFEQLTQISKYAAAMAVRRELPAFRLALLQPVKRDEWYAANPDYISAERRILDRLLTMVVTTGPVASMGASMGGLCAMLLAMADERIGGVFAQSGSFFSPRLDVQESAYPYFRRVTAAVAKLTGAVSTDRPLEVGLTCGELEENNENNHAMADALKRQGHHVQIQDVPDLHNYTAWRDCFDPNLTALLRSMWGTRG